MIVIVELKSFLGARDTPKETKIERDREGEGQTDTKLRTKLGYIKKM